MDYFFLAVHQCDMLFYSPTDTLDRFPKRAKLLMIGPRHDLAVP
ncbi:hypothetical protein ACFSQT_36800 [Mesorhizobium calcicola]|uniref:Uncharacterized protein n=1 Tax=Mesorhizobium calcicola TaxID=1300310 RepID=A0ABW4WPI8_9HYPH